MSARELLCTGDSCCTVHEASAMRAAEIAAEEHGGHVSVAWIVPAALAFYAVAFLLLGMWLA